MANHRKIPADIDLEERARFYGVCARTCRRWWEAGADLQNLESVADLLLRQRNPSIPAMRTIEQTLNSEPTETE